MVTFSGLCGMAIISGISDLWQSLRNPRLIFFMAWSDVRARYKRSVLGPFWITLSTAIGSIGLGFIWSDLMKIDRSTYMPLLTSGLILWQFLSACITESTSVFYKQSKIIRNLQLPLTIYPAQLILRHLINFAHNIPLFFIVCILLGRPVSVNTLFFIPALIIVAANLFWLTLVMGILGSRFRDIEYLVAMIMPLIMFLTPVMYRADSLQLVGKYMWLNPLTSMIEIIRCPLLGEPIPVYACIINLCLFALGGLVALMFFGAKRNRIAFWV